VREVDPMKRIAFVILVLAAVPLIAQQGKEFVPECTLPFDQVAAKQDFDEVCGIDGTGATDPKVLQNHAKNNFCATGDPVLVTFASFKKLETLVEDPTKGLGPHFSVPKTRDKLVNIAYKTSEGESASEGTIVTLAAFIQEAHFADTSSGEDVNCSMKGAENNDVHIALAQSGKETDECKSVTAEMSPHYRPPLWAEKVLNSIKNPVRITGQLMFDASHHPCSGAKRPNPLRMSSWEIHPVYNIEVCKKASLASCKADNDTVWESLDAYMNPATKIHKEDAEGQ
jgi:hypothetical protein